MFLGVDGGGTKTAFVLVDHTGDVLAERVGPASYAFSIGVEGVGAVLADGVRALLSAAGAETSAVTRAFVALPAYGEDSAVDAKLASLVPRVLAGMPVDVGNDAVAGWAGSLGGEDGVNVVAGTGSIAYGELGGLGARAGGWGELFGDEGSGYWVAIEGLRAFSRMADGRTAVGPLLPLLREAVGVTEDLDVCGTVLSRWGGDRTRIAALSRAVAAAADAGDVVAGDLLVRAGQELAALVDAVRSRLRAAPGQRLAVSYSGGMFAVPSVLASFTAALGDDALLQRPRSGPAVGAALVAMRRAGLRSRT